MNLNNKILLLIDRFADGLHASEKQPLNIEWSKIFSKNRSKFNLKLDLIFALQFHSYWVFYLFWKLIDIFSIWTPIMNEMKNGLWNLFLVWDSNENNDNPILYKWFLTHLIAITNGKGWSKSKSFIHF